MYYRGYRIVKALHPTQLQPKRETYDIKDDDHVLKANFATIDGAKFYTDLMIRVGAWPDRKKER